MFTFYSNSPICRNVLSLTANAYEPGRVPIDLTKPNMRRGPDRIAVNGIEVLVDRVDDSQFIEVREMVESVENDGYVRLHVR